MSQAGPTCACPDCGAQRAAGQLECWLCHSRRPPVAPANPYAPSQPTSDNTGLQFSLGSLFLVTTLVAVGFGLFAVLPGLGVLYALFALPAAVRTVKDVTKHKQHGRPLDPVGKLASFLVSLLVMIAATFAACIAGLGVCFAGAWTIQAANPPGGGPPAPWLVILMQIGVWGGLAAFCAAGYGVLWITRPR